MLPSMTSIFKDLLVEGKSETDMPMTKPGLEAEFVHQRWGRLRPKEDSVWDWKRKSQNEIRSGDGLCVDQK